MRTLLITGLLSAMALAATAVAAALPPGGTFVDDDTNIHEGFIEAIAAEGITRGCNPPANDRYCPGSTVTRGQMAALLVRTLGLVDDGGKDWFVDDDDSIFELDINRVAAAGITRGCNPPDNDRYCPEASVTRAQMAAFLTRAYGYTDAGAGNWFVDDDGLVFEDDIDRLRVAGVTLGCNPPDNDRFCPGDLVKRDQMASFIGRAEGLTPITPLPRSQPIVETVVSGMSRPLFLTSPPNDERLFVVEKGGRVRIIANDTLRSQPFLDISNLVSSGGEQGLLGLAFHPAYPSNGRFYVSYTDTSGDSRIVEYTVSTDQNIANLSSARLIITVDQPQDRRNHNGGMITFDTSGNLLFGLGDGGGSGDPDDLAEDPRSLLGSMLRIGVDADAFPGDALRNYTIPPDNPFVGSSSGADEVWAYGLRNPWRFSIDPVTGLMYIADVGQNSREEVNVAPVTQPGIDYGWNTIEGTKCFDPSIGCDTVGTQLPVYEYNTSDGCAITGGYVYRGSDFPELVGHYFYADYCRGQLRSLEYVDGSVTSVRNWSAEFGSVGNVTSFGVDDSQRLYILTDSGSVLRLVPAR